MIIYTSDKLPIIVNDQTAKLRQLNQGQVLPTNATQDQLNDNQPYSGDRRNRNERRSRKLNVSIDRRHDDRRGRHKRTSKTIRIMIRYSDNPDAPGGNRDVGSFINEKV